MAASEDHVQLFDHPGSIARVFKSWFHKPYFPIVTVTRSYDTGDLTISQHSSQQNESHLWDIPINFATSRDPNFENISTDYILPKVPILTLNGNGKFSMNHNEWIIMNKQQTGHYVVNYDQHNWEILAETLTYNHDSIHYLNRAQIVRDVWILHSKGLVSLETAFDVLSYLSQETDLTVWRSSTDTFMYFNNLLEGGKAEEKFKQFVQETLKEILGILGVQNNDLREKPIISETRIFLLDLACEVDQEECLQWAKTQFEKYFEDSVSFDNEALSTILFSGPKLMDDVMFNRTKEERLLGLSGGVGGVFYKGLLQNKNEKNVKMLLKEILSTDKGITNVTFRNTLLVAKFDHVCEVYMELPRKTQRGVLDKLFSISESDDFKAISGGYLSADNMKKMVSIFKVIGTKCEDIFALFFSSMTRSLRYSKYMRKI